MRPNMPPIEAREGCNQIWMQSPILDGSDASMERKFYIQN